MNLAEIAGLLGLNLGLLLAVMTGLWALSRRSGRLGFIDGAWPLAPAALAGVTFLLTDGDPVRRGLLLWLVTIWALPQAWRRLRPSAWAEADARYAATAARAGAGRRPGLVTLILFFLPQAALAWLIALPVQLGQVDFLPPVGALGWAGAVLAVAGIGLEGWGALRLTTQAVDTPERFGGWLRRPDRIGDLAVWWGLWLIAAETGPGRWAILGPAFLTWAVIHWVRTENPRRAGDGG